jgi:hypothetical protein
MAVPYTFGSATTSIPLSQLDSNFATGITLGNTVIQLGNTVTTLNNMTLANVAISSTNGDITINTVRAGLGNASVSTNTAFGVSALATNTTGGLSVAVGYQALNANTTASNNTAVGYQAGYTTTTGDANTFLGYQAGYSKTTSASNTFLGAGAGYLVSTGASNTIIGRYNGNTGGLDIRTSSNYIVLSDGDGNPRGIFDSSGNLLVGTTSAVSSAAYINLRVNPASKWGMGIQASVTDGFNAMVFNNVAGSTVGTIVPGASSTAYNTSSDHRLKENIAPMTGALATVAQLKPCKFKWKATGESTQGFIAHELQEVVPECVTGTKDAVDADGNPSYQGIDTSFLVATLTAAIQEAKALIDTQAETINALTARIVALEAK